MRERVTVLSLSVCVTQQKMDLTDGSLPNIETSIKILHWTFISF